jgi:hypothetical protein
MKRKTKHTFCVQELSFENFVVFEITWKNIVQPDRPQKTTWRMRILRWIPKVTKTLTVCNIYCFSVATMDARTRLNVNVLRKLPALLYFLLAPFLCMNICKHSDNKAYATPTKTDVARIGTSGILFTESIEPKILLLIYICRLPQFAE